jgi:hypothetical protein
LGWLAATVLWALASASTGVAPTVSPDGSLSWRGHWTEGPIETVPFDVGRTWELVLSAWCHVGVDQVVAVVYDADGDEVGRVTIDGEGVRAVVLDTAPGLVSLVLDSPSLPEYEWELLVRPVVAPEREPRAPR